MKELPHLKKILFRAFLTIFRSKKLNNEDYRSESEYIVHDLNVKQIRQYCSQFNFKESLPLPYFYLLCQSIHSSEMIEEKFPLPIPGMVHLESTLNSVGDFNPNLAIEIKSSVSIENKESGSLIPKFIDHFYQEGVKVLDVESIYLVKRKKKGKTKAKQEGRDEKTYDNWISSIWKIPRRMGITYAKISGDFNPIHLFNVFAWLFGFRKKIIHGWYLASRAVAEVEKDTHMPAKSLHVKFEKARSFPSNSIFEFRLSNERNLHFRLIDESKEKTFLSGSIS